MKRLLAILVLLAAPALSAQYGLFYDDASNNVITAPSGATNIIIANPGGLDSTTPYVKTNTGNANFGGLRGTNAANGIASNDVATIGQVRELLDYGGVENVTSNRATYAGDTNTYLMYSAAPAVQSRREYSGLTNGMYVGTVITTGTFSQVTGPIVVHSYIGMVGGSANRSLTVRPEIYYTYSTNDPNCVLGDWDGPTEPVADGTNLYSGAVSFPPPTLTGNVYIVRRWKVIDVQGTPNKPNFQITFGSNTASHISFPHPASGSSVDLASYLQTNDTRVAQLPGLTQGSNWWVSANGSLDFGNTYAQSVLRVDSTNKQIGLRSQLSLSTLVGHWKMNDNATNTAVIDSASGFNGTAFRNTSLLSTSGKVNAALSFNGSSDYVSIPSTNSLNLGQTFSISAWVYLTNDAAAATILSKNYLGYELFTTTGTRLFKVYLSNGSGSYTEYNSGFAIPLSTWSWVGVTFNGASVTLYVGTNAPVVLAKSTGMTANSSSLDIGRRSGGGIAFPGSIDDIRIYSVCLTALGMSYIYNGGAGTELEYAGDPGVYFSYFKSSPQLADLSYVLPAALPSINGFMKCNSSGALTWDANVLISNGGKILPTSDSTNAITIAQSNGTTIAVIDTVNKRIGIGTLSPAASLDVSGGFRFSQVGLPRYRTDWNMSSDGFTANAYDDGGTGWMNFAIDSKNFIVNAAAGAGNFGIKTNNPSQSLDVNGNALVRSNLQVNADALLLGKLYGYREAGATTATNYILGSQDMNVFATATVTCTVPNVATLTGQVWNVYNTQPSGLVYIQPSGTTWTNQLMGSNALYAIEATGSRTMVVQTNGSLWFR